MPKKDYIRNRLVTKELDGYWFIDFTTINTLKIFIILEGSTRQIVGHISKRKDFQLESGEFAKEIVRLIDFALADHKTPVILHSDNEGIFNSSTFQQYLKSKNITHSVAENQFAKHRNQAIERFNRTLKQKARKKLIDHFYLEGNKAKQALNSLSKLSHEEQHDLIRDAITLYNNSPHEHCHKFTPYEMCDSLAHQDKSITDLIPPLDVSIMDSTPNATSITDFVSKSVAKNGTLEGEIIHDEKLASMSDFLDYFLISVAKAVTHVETKLSNVQAKQEETLKEVINGKEAIIANLNQKNAEQLAELTKMADLVKAQGKQLSYLEAEALAREKIQADIEAKRQKRKAQVRQPVRDAATFPELETALNVINNSIDYRSAFAQSRDRVAILILYLSGMRIGNLLKVTSSNLTSLLEGSELRTVAIKSKARAELICPIPSSAHKIIDTCKDDILLLQQNKEPEDFVFTAQGAKAPMERSWLTRRINFILDYTGKLSKKKITSHSFRIGVVTSLTRVAGVDVAKEQIGHSNIQTTYRYTRNNRSLAELASIYNKVEQEKQKRQARYQKPREKEFA